MDFLLNFTHNLTVKYKFTFKKHWIYIFFIK